jgi:hypothetical protein
MAQLIAKIGSKTDSKLISSHDLESFLKGRKSIH